MKECNISAYILDSNEIPKATPTFGKFGCIQMNAAIGMLSILQHKVSNEMLITVCLDSLSQLLSLSCI